MNHISKVLPIREVKDITLFTHHLLMLQIPLMECGLEDWWMSNFINIHYRYENPTFYEYTDFEIFYKNMFDDTKLTFEDSRHFNDSEHFTEFIEQDKYIYAWIDNYYLGASVHYQKRHDIHPILIYGYDNERQIYYIKGFDVERSLFEAEAEYHHVHTALQKAREKNIRLNNEESVLIIKPQYFMKRFTWDYAYQYNRVLSELYDYITGRGKLDGLYFTIREDRELYEQNHSAYGLNVTELFRNALLEQDLRLFDYRVIHMISENKWLIYRRIRYFCEKINASEKLLSLVQEYRQLAESYDTLRNLYIKYAYAETNMRSFYPAPKNPDHVEKLVQKTDELLVAERTLIKEIYMNMISEYLISVRFDKYDSQKMSMSIQKDQNGMFYLFTNENGFEADGIGVFHIHKMVAGRYEFDTGETIEIRARDICNDFLVGKALKDRAVVHSIKFYPDKWVGKDEIDTLALYLCNKKEQYRNV